MFEIEDLLSKTAKRIRISPTVQHFQALSRRIKMGLGLGRPKARVQSPNPQVPKVGKRKYTHFLVLVWADTIL